MPPPEGKRQPCTKIVSCPQFFDKSRDVAKVVAIIRIAHDDKLATCSGNTAHQGVAIASCLHMNDMHSHADSNRSANHPYCHYPPR